MKTIKWTVQILTFALAMNLTGHPAQAQKTPSPDDIRDGVVNVIDPKQISDLLVWARNSKTDLEDGLKKIADLPRQRRHEALRELISDVIGSSGDMSTELLMRSVLRRARNIDSILGTASSSPEAKTLSLRVLEDSARWAIALYKTDENFLNRANNANKDSKEILVDLDFASLGVQHGNYVLENVWLSPSLDARTILVKESFSYFFNDLNRDNIARRNPTIANVLMKMANFATKQGLDKSVTEYLESIKSLSVVQKQNLNRKIEAFYKEQLERASKARVSRLPTIRDEYYSVLSARFVTVGPGRFQMGSPKTEPGRDQYRDVETQHWVNLTRAYAIQRSEVTQRQWFEVMGTNPSHFRWSGHCTDYVEVNGGTLCPSNPVENVSWDDVQQFIARLNAKVGAETYRLPTEAEWEYAARGGTQSAYSFGEGQAILSEYAWFDLNSNRQSHQVCTKKTNPLGLCDMHGNLQEWVLDDGSTEFLSEIDDPLGTSTSREKGTRGGSWEDAGHGLRSAQRSSSRKDLRNNSTGFRLVRKIL